MILRNRTRFRWKDPSHDPKASLRVLGGHLFRLLAVVALSSSAFLIVLKGRYDVPAGRPLAALASIILFIAAVSYVHARCAPCVVVRDRSMSWGVNDETADEWNYEDILSFRIVQGSPGAVLELETNGGVKSQLPIAPGVPIRTLRAFLQAKGIRERVEDVFRDGS